jgi:hypothetical protein
LAGSGNRGLPTQLFHFIEAIINFGASNLIEKEELSELSNSFGLGRGNERGMSWDKNYAEIGVLLTVVVGTSEPSYALSMFRSFKMIF